MAIDELLAIGLNDEGDFTIIEDIYGNKNLSLISGEEYLVQSARIRLTTIRGEYPLNGDFGFPSAQAEGIFNAPYIEGAIRRALKPDPDIVEVPTIDIELDGRRRTVDAAITIRGRDGTTATATGALI